jgi:hypothetical protein
MILYPAIDLKDGQAVRLLRGEMDKATVFNADPAAQARAFQDAGCQWLHLVDLNGAFAGAAGERRGGGGHPRGAPMFPPSSAAASATWPRSRHGWRRGSPA